MNQKHTRRLERLESTTFRDFKTFAFFEVKNGVYRDTWTGKIYQPQEFANLMAKYPDCAFLPYMQREDAMPQFTQEELQAINRAIQLAISEKRPYIPASDPDPEIRAIEARLDAHFQEIWCREMRGWEFMDEQLLLMGREDVVELRRAHREARRRERAGLEVASLVTDTSQEPVQIH